MNTQSFPHHMTQAPSLPGPHEGYMPGFGNDFETEALPGARDFRLGTRDTHGCGDAVDRVEKPRAQRTTGNSS